MMMDGYGNDHHHHCGDDDVAVRKRSWNSSCFVCLNFCVFSAHKFSVCKIQYSPILNSTKKRLVFFSRSKKQKKLVEKARSVLILYFGRLLNA